MAKDGHPVTPALVACTSPYMGQPIEITNLEYSASDLLRLVSREKDGQVVRRLLALALILEGQRQR